MNKIISKMKSKIQEKAKTNEFLHYLDTCQVLTVDTLKVALILAPLEISNRLKKLLAKEEKRTLSLES